MAKTPETSGTLASANKAAADASAAAAAKRAEREAAETERFRSVGAKRMVKAIAALRSVRGLGGRGYRHTETQRAKMLRDLRAEVDAIERALTTPGASAAGYTFE